MGLRHSYEYAGKSYSWQGFLYLYDVAFNTIGSVIFAVTIFSMVLLAQSPKNQPETPADARHTASQLSAATAQANADSNAENSNAQRRMEIFTGVLAGVGVLQFVVMFLTWMVYRRQAGIMKTQIETTLDTERAWIIANPIENAPDVGFFHQRMLETWNGIFPA